MDQTISWPGSDTLWKHQVVARQHGGLAASPLSSVFIVTGPSHGCNFSVSVPFNVKFSFVVKTPQNTQHAGLQCVSVGHIRPNVISWSITRKWAILQKRFYWFINNCTFLFSADSICYILWCDSEGRPRVAPLVLWEMLTGSGAQRADRNSSLSSSRQHGRHLIYSFIILSPVSLCLPVSPHHGRPNRFQEYW